MYNNYRSRDNKMRSSHNNRQVAGTRWQENESFK